MKTIVVKEKVLYVLLLGLFCTFFYAYTDTLNGILIGGLILCGLVYSSPRDKWKVLKQRRHIWFMLLYFLMLGLSLFYSDNQGRGFRYLDTRLALFYFPVGIGLLELSKAFKEKILLGLATITTAACAFCLLWGIRASQFFQHPELLYNDSLTDIIGRQSIYVSLLVNISIFIFSYWIFFKETSGRKKTAMLTAVLFLFVVSYLLASRNMMLVLYAVSFGFLFYYILKKKKYLEGATLLMAMCIGIFLVFKFFPQTINRFRELTFTEYKYENTGKESHYNMEVSADQWNGANFRLAAWKCGWTVFSRSPIGGVGLGDKQDELMKEYARKGFSFGINTKKNVHNNYLDVLMSIGIVGLVLFLFGWILLPLYYAAAAGDWLSFLIICTISLAMITEIYFDRTIGGMIVGFIIPFLSNTGRTQGYES
ncbi:MAG TPA: O-antigen ligase family protein [Flavisolibacter sp.]|jgi:O-antigen ligase|nr:O-antigen ligase family protein [Flavisolibacter sp.]